MTPPRPPEFDYEEALWRLYKWFDIRTDHNQGCTLFLLHGDVIRAVPASAPPDEALWTLVETLRSRGLMPESDGCSGYVSWAWNAVGLVLKIECCCHLHDIPYFLGGTEEEKNTEDARLYWCIVDNMRARHFPLWFCHMRARVFYEAVQENGGPDNEKNWGGSPFKPTPHQWDMKRPAGERGYHPWPKAAEATGGYEA